MAPNTEDCEEVERLNADYQEGQMHQGRRILPEDAPATRAWIENEELPGNDSRTNSPGENRRLLGNNLHHKSSSHLQAGLTLGVWIIPKKGSKSQNLNDKLVVKTKFQRRKEKLKDALRPPYFIITMLFIIVMFHFNGPKGWHAWLEWTPGAWWKQPWRLLTYSLIHADPTHLALNALVALAVGWYLEREQSWLRVAGVWLGGVAAGALGAGTLQPEVKVIGASAAVYALLTAHLPNVFLRFKHIPLWWFRPLSVAVLSASEACWTVVRRGGAGGGPEAPHVAWSAHLLGAAMGIVLGFIVFKGENSSSRVVTALRVASCTLLLAGLVGAVVHYVFFYDIRHFS